MIKNLFVTAGVGTFHWFLTVYQILFVSCGTI